MSEVSQDALFEAAKAAVLQKGHFACAECGEAVKRHASGQKYCAGCAKARAVKRNRERAAANYLANKDEINRKIRERSRLLAEARADLPVPGVDCPKRLCDKCGEPLSVRRNNSTKKGWGWCCKPCTAKARRERYRADPKYKVSVLAGCKRQHQKKQHSEDPAVREAYRKAAYRRSTQSKRRMYADPERHAKHLETMRAWQRRAGNQRNAKLKHAYGITLDQYNLILEKQGYCCAICGTSQSTKNQYDKGNFHTDHCHKAGTVRGLLCDMCNRGLGYFKDDSLRLQKAIEYLNGGNADLIAAVLNRVDA